MRRCFMPERWLRLCNNHSHSGKSISHNIICPQRSLSRIEMIPTFETVITIRREYNCVIRPCSSDKAKNAFLIFSEHGVHIKRNCFLRQHRHLYFFLGRKLERGCRGRKTRGTERSRDCELWLGVKAHYLKISVAIDTIIWNFSYLIQSG